MSNRNMGVGARWSLRGMGRDGSYPLDCYDYWSIRGAKNMLEDPDYDIVAGEDLNGIVLCDVKGDYKEG